MSKEVVVIKKINNCKSGDCPCNGCIKHYNCDRGCKNCKGEHFTCLTLAAQKESKKK